MIKKTLINIVNVILVIALVMGICAIMVLGAKLKNRKPVIKADANGNVILEAADAEILGIGTAEYNVYKGVKNIGWWDHTTQSLRWRFVPGKTSLYEINLNYALPDGLETDFFLSMSDDEIPCTITATGGWDKWKDVTLASIHADAGKTYTFTIKPIKTTGGVGIMNLCRIQLIPTSSSQK